MRFIRIHDPIQLLNTVTKQPEGEVWTHDRYVIGIVLAAPSWLQKGHEGLKSATRIEEAFLVPQDGYAQIEEGDWKALSEAASTFFGGFLTPGARQFLPFVDAIVEATSTRKPAAD